MSQNTGNGYFTNSNFQIFLGGGGGHAPDPLETAPLKVLDPPLDLRLQPLEISYAQQFFSLSISETEKKRPPKVCRLKRDCWKRLCDDHLRQRARTYGFRPHKKNNNTCLASPPDLRNAPTSFFIFFIL